VARILITGAAGFVGRALCRHLAAGGLDVCGVVRSPCDIGSGVEIRIVQDLLEDSVSSEFFSGYDCVVHAAARVHQMADSGGQELETYIRDNSEMTRRLAFAAAQAGVRRFVFLSSVKANGEETSTPYTGDTPPAPEDAYGISKLQAEQALAEVAANSGLETVVLRPPLIYGPDVRANFLSLLRLADTGLPLPLGGLNRNARSLLYLGNLISAISCAIDHPAAAGRTYLLRDGEDLSTAALAAKIRTAFGRPERLVPVPASLIGAAAGIAGRSGAMRRIDGSLIIDDDAIRSELGWRPPFTLDQGLAATASWYRASRTPSH
jgi:nucleoside-diphosphate-sugar epimerase